MAFLDDFDKKITSWGQGAIQKTKDVSDNAKLTNMIRTLENQKKECFAEIGRLYYKECQEKEVFDKDEFSAVISQQLSEIHRLDCEIREKQEQVRQIKGTIFCPSCNAEIPQNSLFCNVCGFKLEKKPVSPVAQTGRKCQNCNAPLEEDQLFCTNCGTKVEPAAEPVVAEPVVVEPIVAEPELLIAEPEMIEEPVMQERQCPQCKAAVSEDQLFCTNCGTRLESAPVIEEIIPQEPDVKRCPSCSAEVDEDQRFCVICGTRL